VTPTVAALGATSFLTDVASEMVASVLPLYLTLGLGLPIGAIGVVDGLQQATVMAARPLGGIVADRTGRPKRVAVGGYGISAVARGGLAVGAVAGIVGWWIVVWALATDRVGKGIRTGPRDALISRSAPTGALAAAFGVHRCLDTAGALGGPLLALVLLGEDGRAFDAVLVTAALIGVAGLAVITLLVEDPQGRTAAEKPAAAIGAAHLVRRPAVGRLLAAAGVLGLGAVPDSMLSLAVITTTGLPLRWFPLLATATAATFVVLAVPLGHVADRVGHRRMLLGGHLLLVPVLGLVAASAASPAAPLPVPPTVVLVGFALALHGAHYAATDGVLAAMASARSAPEARSTVLSLASTANLGGRLAGAAIVGVLWHAVGLGTALGLAAGMCFLGVVAAARLLGDASP
jgi:MFS family permease